MTTRFERLREMLSGGGIQRSTAAAWMNVLVAAPVVVAFLTVWGGWSRDPTPEQVSIAALKVFAVWCLAFLPGWLYVRFLGQRAGALWNEYVLNLHRLGLDDPEFLPRPPRTSAYYEEWESRGGPQFKEHSNLYQQKFIAYYGRSVPEAARATEQSPQAANRALQRTNFAVRGETMFPVFLTTLVLAVVWVTVLWDLEFLENPTTVWDVLKYALLGAYAFIAQALVRRFFQNDLRPTAYTAAILRIVFVLAITATLHAALAHTVEVQTEAVVAFAVGFFPLVGLHALQRSAAAVLKVAVPQLAPAYPLNEIDGLNLWYETRLVEEGIEDMENLVTANLVDVMLHTRVPVGRLVDWKDQAHLYLHLDRTEHGFLEARRARRAQRTSSSAPAGSGSSAAGTGGGGTADGPGRPGTRTRVGLRQLGVRNATDLLKAFPPDVLDPDAGGPGDQHITRAVQSVGLDPDLLRTIVRVLREDTGLAPVLNWQRRGIGLCAPPSSTGREGLGRTAGDQGSDATSSPGSASMRALRRWWRCTCGPRLQQHTEPRRSERQGLP